MRSFWYAAHLLGLVAWMGGAWPAALLGRAGARRPGADPARTLQLRVALYRTLVGPGAIATVLSGLVLTLSRYGAATSTGGLPRSLIVMQLAGLAAGAITIVAVLPTALRLTRIDPAGEYAGAYRRLSASLARWDLVSGLLAVVALLGGAMMR